MCCRIRCAPLPKRREYNGSEAIMAKSANATASAGVAVRTDTDSLRPSVMEEPSYAAVPRLVLSYWLDPGKTGLP
jgi:hypothetical protein